METKIHKQLDEARGHFYSWRMVEAYNIFRRFFDRLPFRLEKEHAENISMFVRVLGELGKINELKFYVGELERHYEKSKDPVITYALAVVYSNSSVQRPESARKLLDELVRNPAAQEYHARAKLFLANYYDRHKDDTAACRTIIDSIGDVTEPSVKVLVDIWRAKLLREEKKYAESEALLNLLFSQINSQKDWYPYFSAKVVLAILFLKQKRLEEASATIDEVRKKFEGRHFKTIQIQLDALQRQIEEESRLGIVRFVPGDNDSTFHYSNRSLKLKKKSTAEKLLSLLVRKKFLDKGVIVRNLYNRQYEATRDDKLVYYHIHSLRKRLLELGLPSDAIRSEGEGYRFVPEVETVGEPAWV
jgi:tetratricopeptide (TPR) repeat protein